MITKIDYAFVKKRFDELRKENEKLGKKIKDLQDIIAADKKTQERQTPKTPKRVLRILRTWARDVDLIPKEHRVK